METLAPTTGYRLAARSTSFPSFDPAPFATVPPADQTGPKGLVVGRLEWLKGVDVMLNAAANLRATGVDLNLVFAGVPAGEIEGVATGTWLKPRARESRVALPARRPRCVQRTSRPLRGSPGRRRAQPVRKLLRRRPRGMAAARPVVATSTNGMAYLIERSSGGTIVPPDDPQALAAAIAPYLADPGHAAATGARGRTEVASLNATMIARRREEAYRRAIDAHRRRCRKHVLARG